MPATLFFLTPFPVSNRFSEEGTKQRPFSHALIVGIEEAPLRVTEEMTVEKIAKRSRVKPFVKVINFNHLLITRYTVDNLDFKGILSADEAKDPSKKLEAKKALKELFQERYVNGSNKWLFQKLRF